MLDRKELLLLFSGGTDSTYTAVLMSKRYERIHLVTYDRHGFINIKNSEKSASLLKDRFGQDRFVHKIINIDSLFKKISYSNYFKDMIKYGFFQLSTCGLCKLAMHWQSIIYCLDNNIKDVCDGSNREMKTDSSQDEEIIKEMKLLYEEFELFYFDPVFNETRQVREKTNFDLKLSPVQSPKWTRFSWERQHFCTQEYLFLKFFNYVHTDWKGRHTEEKAIEYRKTMIRHHKEKRDFIRAQVHRYLQGKRFDG